MWVCGVGFGVWVGGVGSGRWRGVEYRLNSQRVLLDCLLRILRVVVVLSWILRLGQARVLRRVA